MNLSDLPTPCLVLDRTILSRNIRVMAAALTRLSVPLRPHMKTAKCIEVARLATAGQPGRHHRLHPRGGGILLQPRHDRYPVRRGHHAAEAGAGRRLNAEGRAHYRDHRRPGDGRPDRRPAGPAAHFDRDRQR